MPQKYEITSESRSFHSKGEYRVRDTSGRWSSWKKVNGGLQEALEAADKAEKELRRKSRK